MRKPRNARYTIKAYYIENETTKVFYCKENKIRDISNEMGASMPMSNGERMLETDSPIKFEMEQEIKIGNETLSIVQTNGNVDPKDLNALRGKPRYIQTILIK